MKQAGYVYIQVCIVTTAARYYEGREKTQSPREDEPGRDPGKGHGAVLEEGLSRDVNDRPV